MVSIKENKKKIEKILLKPILKTKKNFSSFVKNFKEKKIKYDLIKQRLLDKEKKKNYFLKKN